MRTRILNFSMRSLTKLDVDIIYDLCKENELYYQFCPPFVTKTSILKDMFIKPDNVLDKDKHYLGIFKERQLIAILDLITHYPNVNTVFLGFFMVRKSIQNRGIGSKIINELICQLQEDGYQYVQLAWIKGNLQSERFWIKNLFQPIKERKSGSVNSIVILAKRRI